MKLLLLLSFVALTLGEEPFVPEKLTEANDITQQPSADLQVQSNEQVSDDKKIAKRSYGWGPWGGYSYGWPWYGWGGHGWYGGWPYGGWPYGYGYGGHGYVAYRGWPSYGGWYKGW